MRKVFIAFSGLALLQVFTAAKADINPSVFDPLVWLRPVDNPVFTSAFGNNHDSILFVEPEKDYPYYLIVSHTPEFAQL